MKNILDFLIDVGKLKKMPRRGWVINEIENPESIAEHIFRTSIMSWVLGFLKKLNTIKLIKMALVHDLCEIYAGDTTPYDSVLPQNKKKLRELMKTWPRFSSKKKQRLVSQKLKKEKKALEKVLGKLPLELKKEMKILWWDRELGLTREGRFFRQADRIENFLQALEYWKKYQRPPLGPWWLWAREFFDDPLLIKMIKRIEKRFHKKNYKDYLIDFFIKIGKLKGKKRKIAQVDKTSETVAEHNFLLAILVWVLGQNKKINLEKAIKMALIHNLDGILNSKWFNCNLFSPPFNKKAMKNNAIEKLISHLSPKLKKEFKLLWLDFWKELSPEAKFVKQADRIINLLLVLEQGKSKIKFSLKFLKETIQEPVFLNFISHIQKTISLKNNL